ncbi:hypothetical protein THAOC_10352 [Thalassiosira oceanica]|uniref:Uncharacterized protein n=1 Tax=Thalassiosira oceanica TaxID=159749 RepID=K0SST8_THAOC|nr:hypothetical protein THAOC_10352 [Thalassiosira oceanica]|eukprot:EJK68465.1 hypothetical protein THAOC_10352 [Thalassiosira oceanica]
MANGENRAAIKKSVDDVGKSMEKGFKDIGEGLKKVTLGIGKGISDVATGTVDAILNPETIPNKLDSAFDRAIIQPTKRTVDFIEESAHKVAEDTDRVRCLPNQIVSAGATKSPRVIDTPFFFKQGMEQTSETSAGGSTQLESCVRSAIAS